MPDNYVHLGLLATLFPNAVFIHCRRDLRDVAVSCWMTGFRSVHWTNDPRHIAMRVRAIRPLDERTGGRCLPAPIHDVDYEETVDDLEGSRGACLDACGLEWEPACLEFHRNSAAGPNRQLQPGTTTRLPQLDRPLAEL